MKTAAVLEYFTKRHNLRDDNEARLKVAEFLGVTRQAVEQWGPVVPESSAFKLHVMTDGALRADPEFYARQKVRKIREKRAA